MLCLDSRIGTLTDIDDYNQPTDGQIMIEATKLLFETFNKLYYGYPLWKWFHTAAYNDLIKAESMIYEIASKYIEQAMNQLSNGYESDKQTVLQKLLNTKNLSNDEVKVGIIDFIIGGIFTVSNTFP